MDFLAPAEADGLPLQHAQSPCGFQFPQFDPTTCTVYSFLIDASQIGRIIGRQGCTVRELEQTSGARIFISSCSSEAYSAALPRLVTIDGPPGCIAAAVSLINVLLCTPPANGTAAAAAFFSQELLVERQHIGKVIGAKGDTIRGLQALAQVRIQIDQSADPCLMVVTGATPDACASCCAFIADIVSGQAEKHKYSYTRFTTTTAQMAHAAACWAAAPPPSFDPFMYGPLGHA